MQMDDMVLISVDDHLIEPSDMFDRHTPAKFKGKMPKVIQGPQGEDMWLIGDMPVPNIALNAVAGRRPEEYGFEPTGFGQLRKGTYDVHARVGDMNANGQLAGLNFPSFVGVGGQTLEKVQDRELGLAIVRAWNDWHIDEWCGAYPGRFIPVGIVSNWDPVAAAEEVRRIAKKGCNAISFPPNPCLSKLPSLHNPIWDPLWKACSDTGVVICLHIADASNTVPSIESPVDVMIANMPVSLYTTATDLTFSPVLRKFPDIRFALSEGGVGWIPHFLERIDYVHERHIWTNQDFGGLRPSELFQKHVYTCFIDDKVGIKVRHEAGLSNMTWECDYPHSDSTWPKAPETLWPSIKDIPDNEIDMITHLNAMKAFKFDPFQHMKKEECTVGALRAQAADVDLSFSDTEGKGVPPALHKGPVTFGDVTGQLSKMLDVGVGGK